MEKKLITEMKFMMERLENPRMTYTEYEKKHKLLTEDSDFHADKEHPLRKVKGDKSAYGRGENPHDRQGDESMYGREEDFMDEDGEFDDEEVPIGVDNLESQGTSGLVLLFSPLESDMVKDWNNDKQIQRFVEEERLSLNELSYDEWEIYGIEGDRQVRNYIMKNYSW